MNEQLMLRLGTEVVADLSNWNATDDPEVKEAFNAIRDALAKRPLWFANSSIEHSKGRNPPWVGYKFKGRLGEIHMTWYLSQHLADLADIASSARRASDKEAANSDLISMERTLRTALKAIDKGVKALQPLAGDPRGTVGPTALRDLATAKTALERLVGRDSSFVWSVMPV